MRFSPVTLLTLFSSLAFADVEITSPAAGASLPAGPITVTWKESGTGPALSALLSYTIQLYVGGNTADNSQPLTVLANGVKFAAGTTSFTGTITPGLAGNTANGFYLKMVSVATEGGTVTSYSNRFSLTGMTGVTGTTFAQAVTDLDGSTQGPKGEDDLTNNVNPGAAPTAAGGPYAVPYNLQTGLTKYAPMQPVPGTKITRTTFAPLFPTSAYTVATTWMPQATILTTLTASQTFSVSSIENPASAQSQPAGDMARFLARWKD